MDKQQIPHQTCPFDGDEATLLVDVETETIPVTDEEGDIQYYCPTGQHVFSVDEDGKPLI